MEKNDVKDTMIFKTEQGVYVQFRQSVVVINYY